MSNRNNPVAAPRAPARQVPVPAPRRPARRERRVDNVPDIVTELQEEVRRLRAELEELRGAQGMGGAILPAPAVLEGNSPKNEMANFRSIKRDQDTERSADHMKKPPMVFDAEKWRRPVAPRTASLTSPRVLTRLWQTRHRDAVTADRVDSDLLYHLRLYSAFQPRTLTLVNSLKMRAIRWMGDFNCVGLDSQEIYTIITNTVIEAFTIHEEERKLKTRIAEETDFYSHNKYFRSGPLVKD